MRKLFRSVHLHTRVGLSHAIKPVCYTMLFVLIMFVWRLLRLPDPDNLIETISIWLENGGILVVATAAFIEGLLVINLAFPGSAVIVLSVIASRGNLLLTAEIILAVSIAFLTSAQVNYVIGYYGLHHLVVRVAGKNAIVRAHRWYDQFGPIIIPISFVHPNLGAFVSVACGSARFKWQWFFLLGLVSIVVWNCIWGAITYFFADHLRFVATRPQVTLTILMLWSCGAFLYGVAISVFRGRRLEDVDRNDSAG